MGAVGFAGLTLLAEADLAIGLDGERGGVRGGAGFLGREGAVTVVVRGASWWCEDGGGIGPVQEGV